MAEPDHPLEKRFYYLPHSEVNVPDFPAEGFILDVGGGGEGVIGRVKGGQVVASGRPISIVCKDRLGL